MRAGYRRRKTTDFARRSSPDPSRRGGFIDLAARPLAEDRARNPGGRAVVAGLHARQQANDEHERIESELLGELDDLRASGKIADRLRDRGIEFGEVTSLKPMGRLIPVDIEREPSRAGWRFGSGRSAYRLRLLVQNVGSAPPGRLAHLPEGPRP